MIFMTIKKKAILTIEEKSNFEILIDGICTIILALCLILCMAGLTKWGWWVLIPAFIDVIITQVYRTHEKITHPFKQVTELDLSEEDEQKRDEY